MIKHKLEHRIISYAVKSIQKTLFTYKVKIFMTKHFET